MKWFFALNEMGNDFPNYADMAKVAVYTALEKTSLEPHFIYDGEENDLTVWLRNRSVKIINRRSFLFEALRKESEKRDNNIFWHIGAGTFLRLEVPEIVKEQNYTDDFVLYTDVDVMFKAEVCDYLQTLKPKYFAVAPEFFQSDYNNMNSGVMLMNVGSLMKNENVFRDFVKKNLFMLVDQAFDQGAYRLFYQRNKIVRKIFGNKWNKLKVEYNWKPYWGKTAEAKIIHFHGPKPHQTEDLLSDNVPEHLKHILPLVRGGYLDYEKEWKLNLKLANETN